MNVSRRSLFKAFAALVAAPAVQKLLPAKTGIEAWLPTSAAKGTFYSIDRTVSTVSTAILKSLWPQSKIDAMVYETDFTAALIKSQKPK